MAGIRKGVLAWENPPRTLVLIINPEYDPERADAISRHPSTFSLVGDAVAVK